MATSPNGTVFSRVTPTGEAVSFGVYDSGQVSEDPGHLAAAFRSLGLAEAPRAGTRFGDVHTFVHQARAFRRARGSETGPIEAKLARGALHLAGAKGLAISPDLAQNLNAALLGDAWEAGEVLCFRMPRPSDGVAEPADMPSVLSDIHALIGAYSYHQYNLLETSLSILCNPNQRALLIDHFYRYDRFPTEGNCLELALTAWRDIKAFHPRLDVALALGNEPKFYSDPESSHWFLVLYDGATPEDPWVIDPTFGKLERLSGSGYAIRQVHRVGQPLAMSNQRLLQHGHSSPLAVMADGKLAYLTGNMGVARRMEITFQSPREGLTTRALQDSLAETLDISGADPRLSRVIRHLAGTHARISGDWLAPEIQVFVE